MFQLPNNVKNIITKFNEAGYEAYAVGGCVRDTLLCKEPQDWDITTSATPQEMKQIFTKTIDTGIQHGTVTVRMGGESYEVTTYRIDGEYEDGRHPKQVQFTSNLREDLRRRDFTINAMAYSDESGLVDMFEGEKDLKERRIRAVGNPMERFSEDALRMLRAVRFAAQLGFSIEEETKNAIKFLAPNLQQVSKERIHTEFVKLLSSPHPEEVMNCFETGLLEQFFPELDEAIRAVPEYVTSVIMKKLQECVPDKDLRLCLLFDLCAWPRDGLVCGAASSDEVAVCDVASSKDGGVCDVVSGEEEGLCLYASQVASKVLRGLKLDGNTIRRTSHLLKFMRQDPEMNPAKIRKYFSEVGEEYGDDVVYLKQLIYGKSKVVYLEDEWNEIKSKGYCIAIKDLAVTGSDLLELGVSQGKEVGAYLKEALNYVLENPYHNQKETVLEYIKTRMC